MKIVYEDKQEIWVHVEGNRCWGEDYGNGYIVDRYLNKT